MKVNLYAINDSAVGYMTPFPMHTHNLAIRSFAETCKQPDTNLSKYPEQHSLFFIGQWDDELGLLHPQSPPELLTTAQQCLTKEKLHEISNDNES